PTPFPGDVVVLAEHASQIAVREEDGPRPPGSTQAALLAVMGKGTRDAGPATRLADRPLTGQSVDVTISRTDAADAELFQGLLYLFG
ncbi:MAG: hypothetical protein WBP10_15685, partial [Thermoanaerobaculia bacterium]